MHGRGLNWFFDLVLYGLIVTICTVVGAVASLIQNIRNAGANGIVALGTAVIAIATIFAACAARDALQVYRTTNSIAVSNQLDARYAAVSASYLDGDNIRYSSVFDVPCSECGEVVGKNAEFERLMKFIRIGAEISAQTTEEAGSRMERVNAAIDEIRPEFDGGIPQFSCALWSQKYSDNLAILELRKYYFSVENLLYIVHDAFSAYERGVFKVQVGDTDAEAVSNKMMEYWNAILSDIKTHPMLLLAIHDGQKYGYITKEFSGHVWDQFSPSGSDKSGSDDQVLCEVYPDLAAARGDWLDTYHEETCQSASKAAELPRCIALGFKAGPPATR